MRNSCSCITPFRDLARQNSGNNKCLIWIVTELALVGCNLLQEAHDFIIRVVEYASNRYYSTIVWCGLMVDWCHDNKRTNRRKRRFYTGKAILSRVWSRCETMQDKYVTFLARPGSRLATLVLQEMQDHMYIGTYCQYVVEK
jgi:hypothetical protein